MNKTILQLEKRKAKVISLRNDYKYKCDKESHFETELKRYDSVLDRIVQAIRREWNKIYSKGF